MLKTLDREDLLNIGKEFSAECIPDGKVSLYKLRHELKNNLRKIRQMYKKAILGTLSEKTDRVACEWICDNYYLIDREGKAAYRSLKSANALPSAQGEYPMIYRIALKLCQVAVRVGKDEYEQFLQGVSEGYSLSNDELYAFKGVLITASITFLAEECMKLSNSGKGSVQVISGAITSLRALSGTDFSESFEKLSECEAILASDPSGDYPDMSDETKEYYRRCVSLGAKRRGITEKEFALKALENAKNGEEYNRHIGFHLDSNRNHHKGIIYLILYFLLPLSTSLFLGFVTRNALVGVYLFLPLTAIFKSVLESLITPLLKHKFICSMNPEKVSNAEKTVVVISCLITSPEQIKRLIKNLIRVRLSGKEIVCGLLADFKESDAQTKPEDIHLLSVLEKEIRRLNKDNGGGFFAVVRKRTFVECQGKYMGAERKRGAITEFIRYIKNSNNSAFSLMTGEYSKVTGAKYLLTLDADTEVSMNSVAELTAVLMHPLNKIQIKNNRVTNGFGIAVPRLTTDINTSSRTAFSRVFAGSGGLHSYGGAGGDFFQDIFGEGLFTGKGLIDVEAYHTLIDGAFPLNKILSHDILEGGVMKTCVLPETEFSDSFPTTVKSWMIRLARWVRGDFQNGIFIKNLILNENGERVKSNLGIFDKYKIYENIRRALTPVYILSFLVFCIFTSFRFEPLLLTIAMLSISPGDVLGSLKGILKPTKAFRRFISRAVPNFLAGCTRIVLNFLMLPQLAFIGIGEGLKAVWRSCFSHKNMLEWMTAAEAENGRGNSVIDYYAYMWFNVVAGVMFFFLGALFFKVLGILWIIAPALFCEISRPARKDKYILKEDDEEMLYSSASAMWRYFEKYVTEETNFLPPDNVQYSPYRVAMRTSPTNIGLYLLCALSARDFGFIDSSELADRLLATLKSVDCMKKWHGNLYNWYDISTLDTLHPEYVSSVDSGNFLCCLTALKEGVRDYLWEETRLGEVAFLAEKLLREADISALYNKRRKLFYIGYDAESNTFGNNMYDILMSEARMTSYYAISKKIADKKHWGMLGRLFAGSDGYVGPVSWTGTMFEYYMPHLLIPVVDNSLSDEALKYALYCQKKRVSHRKLPWGISESGFHAFDAAQNYQYKAFGVQKLGLKRGLDDELVISPYSTYLVLPFAPEEAITNLRKLINLGLNGEFGLYEAIDFTASRVGGGFGIVKSYMAHHLGMSLLSVTNMIFDGIMQKRFMRDMDMASGQKILEEAIYDEVSLYKGVSVSDVKVRNRKVTETDTIYNDSDPGFPRAAVLTNGEFSSVITDGGCGFSIWNGINVNNHNRDTRLKPIGVFAFLKEGDGTPFSITSAPMYDGVIRRSEFSSSAVAFTAVKDGLEAAMGVCVHGRIPAEIRGFKVGNTDKRKKDCELLIYAEPILRKEGDYKAHPAFSDIFLMSEYLPEEKCLLLWRKGAEGEESCVAYGFSDRNTEFEFETDKSNVLEKGKGIFSLKNAFNKEFSNRDGTPIIPCVALRSQFSLRSGENKSLFFIQAVGKTRQEALSRLLLVRRQSLQSIMKTAQETVGSIAAGSVSYVNETKILSKVIPRVFFQCPSSKEREAAIKKNNLGKNALWSMSVSGDKPIVTCLLKSEEEIERGISHIKAQRVAKMKGIDYDLCIVFSEAGAYDSKIRNRLFETISKYGMKSTVFLLDRKLLQEEKVTLLKAASVYIDDGIDVEIEERRGEASFTVSEIVADTDAQHVDNYVPGGGFEENSFVTFPQKSKSSLPWCFPIANRNFGTLVSDSSLGFSFYLNSYLNQLTPWSNEYMNDNYGEKLYIKYRGRYYDPINGAFVRFSKGTAEYISCIDEIRITVKVSVHEKLPCKSVKVIIHNSEAEDAEVYIAYCVFPKPANFPSDLLKIKTKNGVSLAENPINSEYSHIKVGVFSLGGDPTFVESKEKFFTGKWEENNYRDGYGKCIAAIKKHQVGNGKTVKDEFILAAGNEHCIFRCYEILKKEAEFNSRIATGSKPAFKLNTPDEQLNKLMNFYLPYQTEISRVYSRTGFSQNSGAFGFRDQLQDVCSLIYSAPNLVKSHILKAASAQFMEGDVLHWWHKLPGEAGFKGVRTKCSDDLLWLPYAVAFYVRTTADSGLLEIPVNFLDGERLSLNETEKYISPIISGCRNIYEHCKRAFEFAYKKGKHGLLLVGSGDWNDGMNRVGVKGKGESVWLSMFAMCVMRDFIPICEQMNDYEFADVLRKRCAEQLSAIESDAWEGDRYIRGYHDDGSKLGNITSQEAKIDSLPQSFSIFAGCQSERSSIALETALKKLVVNDKNIVRLFDPPYNAIKKDIGYIKAYPKGIRENGGQYTHAAVWLAKALLMSGRGDEGYKVLDMISPITHSFDSCYKTEPYFLAADIYTAPSCVGRGGWSIYTGAAGWYYRTVIEDMLGIRKVGNKLYLSPCVPKEWSEFEFDAFLDGIDISVAAKRTGEKRIFVNEEEVEEAVILDGSNKKIRLEF